MVPSNLVHDDFIEFYNLILKRWEHVGNTLGAHLVRDDFIEFYNLILKLRTE
jgi:hypothetical protein